MLTSPLIRFTAPLVALVVVFGSFFGVLYASLTAFALYIAPAILLAAVWKSDHPLRSITITAFLWVTFDHRLSTKVWEGSPYDLSYSLGALTFMYLLIVLLYKSSPCSTDKMIDLLPGRRTPLKLVATTTLALCALLLPLAWVTGFVSTIAWHPGKIFPGFLLIYFGIALPEELAFRAILQKKLTKYIDARWAITLAAVLFGLTHWNNGQQLWDIRYIGLATLAGCGYGYVYEKSRSLAASALVHASIDCIWVAFFME